MQMTELLVVPTHLAVSQLLKTLRPRKMCMVSIKDMVSHVWGIYVYVLYLWKENIILIY
jgi:hypothetical protein